VPISLRGTIRSSNQARGHLFDMLGSPPPLPSRAMPVDATSARLRCNHDGCEGLEMDEHYCVGPDGRLFGIGFPPAYASPGPAPRTTSFTAASGKAVHKGPP
jgi:hypothetical protein